MEEAGILDRNNNMHFSALRYVFPPRINRAVEMLKEAWNLHQAQTECSWTPKQICLSGMIDLLAETVPGFDDLNWYEFDLQAPHPHHDELTTVAADDIDNEIP